MAKIRVYELARRLGLESKDVLEAALDLGFAVKTASSGLEPAAAERVQDALGVVPREPAVEDAPAEQAAVETEADSTVEAVPVAEEGEQAPPPDQAIPADEPSWEPTSISVAAGVTPSEFAELSGRPVGEVVKSLVQLGEKVSAAAPIPDEALELVGETLNVAVDVISEAEEEPAAATPGPRRTFDDDPADLMPRPPVITVMGHVDHGKTTLLDTIREENVVAGEHGGITQHIGAYQVGTGSHVLTFLDTPGHEAFTALRARGAEVTDIVVLVVAAEDGVMPQTVEAISHAKAAGVNIIVTLNKMDLPGADPHSVRAQLTEHGLVAEELGGDVITVELSAATGEGVDQLLEMIELVSQLEEFKGNPKPQAAGVVIESQLDKGRGPVGTVIVQRGTLRRGDPLVAGPVSGRVRAMLDHNGQQVKEAGPGTPVLVLGWDEVPTAGDAFDVTDNDKSARALAAERQEELKAASIVMPTAKERLESLLERLRTSDEAELRLIVKADAHGSLEALHDSISKITREGGSVTIVHGAVGGINDNDISLADVTDSVIVGFNVRPDANARRGAKEKGVEILTYQIIYELLDEVERLLVGRLAPEEVEVVLGSAEVREIFKTPRIGNVAGCYVTEGELQRGAKVRLLREGVIIHTGEIGSLRRFKDDVRAVAAGFECGVGLAGYQDVKQGDVIEAFEVQEVARQ